MDGVGNFTVNNRTLYIGGVVSSDDVRDTEVRKGKKNQIRRIFFLAFDL